MFHLQPSSYVHPSQRGGRDGWTNGHVVDSGIPRCFKRGGGLIKQRGTMGEWL